MIKHRFILPSADDFKIFAAIPCETSVLTWKRWQRPPNWEAMKEIIELSKRSLQVAESAFDGIEKHARRLHAAAVSESGVFLENAEDVATLAERMASHIEWASVARARVREDLDRLARVIDVLPPPEDQRTPELFEKAIELLVTELSRDVDPDKTVDKLATSYRLHVETLESPKTRAIHPERERLVQMMRGVFKLFAEHLDSVERVLHSRLEAAGEIKQKLCSSEPLPETPCPPGVPFAAYTVEFNDIVVNVVEGCAWVMPPSSDKVLSKQTYNTIRKTLLAKGETLEEVRRGGEAVLDMSKWCTDPTDAEKRVTEIVSQMLTERSLNPKADTRVPVREIDPKHAHQTREAERRDTTGRVRTIKFAVTPPRYLREAAERILSSPRKAHWVIGHWRNQVHGEGRTLRRQTWIKPHIRGLGEASAVVAAVIPPTPAKVS